MEDDLVSKILSVLNESPSPLTAPEIAERIPGCNGKKQINQLVYKMGTYGVEKVEGSKPPKWTLTEEGKKMEKTQESVTRGATAMSTPSTPTTEEKSTDNEIGKEVLRYLEAHSPSSAPNIHKALQDKLTCDTADIKRVLGQLEKQQDVYNKAPKGEKPLWVSKKSQTAQPGNNESIKLDGKPLFTFDEKSNGQILLNPVKPEQLSVTEDKVLQNSCEPDSDVPSETVAEPTIISRGSLPLPVPETTPLQPPLLVEDRKSDDSESTPKASKKKHQVQLAAKFGGLSLAEPKEDDLRQSILQFLRSHHGEEFTPRDIATQLGCPTRDRVQYILNELKEEDIVEETNDRYFKIKQ